MTSLQVVGHSMFAQLRNSIIFIFQYLPFEEGGQLNQLHFSKHVWFKKVGGSGKDVRWTWKENLVQTLKNSTSCYHPRKRIFNENILIFKKVASYIPIVQTNILMTHSTN